MGAKPAAHASRDDSTPIKDAQLTRLIEGIPDARWKLAVQLMACFGLRPVELKYIRPTEDGARLYCGYCKRTAKGSTKPREIVGIDPAGHPGMSIQLLAQLSAIGRVRGATELPPLGNNDRATASAIDTYLRRPVWMALGSRWSSNFYSFRHGYMRHRGLMRSSGRPNGPQPSPFKSLRAMDRRRNDCSSCGKNTAALLHEKAQLPRLG